MSLIEHEITDEMLSTLAAAQLAGRSQAAVRNAIREGYLTGGVKDRDRDGVWLVPRSEVLAWAARTRKYRPRRNVRAWERVAEALAEWGPASAEELGRLLQLHAGNTRKHLRILEVEGRAHRGADGQWELTDHAQEVA